VCSEHGAPTNELHRRSIAVDVNKCPQRCLGIDPGEEDALLLAIDVKEHITAQTVTKRQDGTDPSQTLRQRLGPESRTICQIRTCIAWQRFPAQRGRVVQRESKPQCPAPAGRHLGKPDEDGDVRQDGSTAEADAFAERVDSSRPATISRQLYVVAVNVVK